MLRTISKASEDSSVLLVQAPYPGKLKFRGVPGSLLAAASPFLCSERGGEEEVGYLDPTEASPAFYTELRQILAAGRVRVLCLSTSTAAIEEAAEIAALAKACSPRTLVLAGGPHEDDCDSKIASQIPEVDVSIGGEGEHALAFLLREFLDRSETPAEFCRLLPERLRTSRIPAGRFSVTSSWWPRSGTYHMEFGAIRPQELKTHVLPEELPHFTVFSTARTLPLMISRGCPYGRCTFCAEGIRGKGTLVQERFDWISELSRAYSDAALYFQDSIFPTGETVRRRLLPLLRELGVEWGAQVYLRLLTRRTVEELAAHGCRYLYTGLESGSPDLLRTIGKPGMDAPLALERLAWMRDCGIKVGISLMFGVMAPSGALLETRDSIQQTIDLVYAIRGSGVMVAGFYPNVETVLPSTALASSLRAAGTAPDFYRMPQAEVFEALEDGGIGYNFFTIAPPSQHAQEVARLIVEAARLLTA